MCQVSTDKAVRGARVEHHSNLQGPCCGLDPALAGRISTHWQPGHELGQRNLEAIAGQGVDRLIDELTMKKNSLCQVYPFGLTKQLCPLPTPRGRQPIEVILSQECLGGTVELAQGGFHLWKPVLVGLPDSQVDGRQWPRHGVAAMTGADRSDPVSPYSAVKGAEGSCEELVCSSWLDHYFVFVCLSWSIISWLLSGFASNGEPLRDSRGQQTGGETAADSGQNTLDFGVPLARSKDRR